MLNSSIAFPAIARQAVSSTVARVFIVDDDMSVREALEGLIRSAGWQTDAFASAGDFLAHADLSVPSCLVLDIGLPDMSGLDVQRIVKTDDTSPPIVFITGSGDIPTAVQAMRAGAVEFLAKPVGAEQLLAAIERALAISREHVVEAAERATLRRRYASLTPREVEVMAMVVAGRLNKQIGFELEISEITVKAHRGKMMRKMMALSVPDLVRMAAKIAIAT